MGFLEKISNILVPEDKGWYEDDMVEEIAEDRVSPKISKISDNSKNREDSKVVSMNKPVVSQNLEVFEPEKVIEAKKVASALRSNKICVVSLRKIDNKEDSQSIADYLTGAAFVLNGEITKFSESMFMVSPQGVDVKNNMKDFLDK